MDFIQSLVSGAVGAAIIGGSFTVVQSVVSKRVRSPADKLAGEEFAYRVLKERLDEANADRKVLSETVDYLREDARKRDAVDAEDFDREQKRIQLVRDLNRRIGELENHIRAYENRLSMLAEKVRAGNPITVSDIYDIPDPLPEDLEDTLRTH